MIVRGEKQFTHEEILIESLYEEYIVFLAINIAQTSSKYIYSVKDLLQDHKMYRKTLVQKHLVQKY